MEKAKSTDDKRNKFRSEYRELTDQESERMDKIKELAGTLDDLIGVTADEEKENGRLVSIAQTKLETSIMYAIKAITK